MMKKTTLLLMAGLLPVLSAHALQWTSENVVDADTLLLYRFNGSGTTLVDETGNFSGTLASAASRAGSAPGWLTTPSGDFLTPSGNPTNGMNANVTVNGVDFNTGLTISFWYRSEVGQTHSGELFQMEGPRTRLVTDDFGTGGGGRLRLTGNNTLGNLVDFGGEGTWRHIGIVYDPLNASATDGGEWRMYLDNSLADTIVDSGDLGSDTSFTLRVGENTFSNAPLQGGSLDEFLISNRVITDFSAAVIPEPSSLALMLISVLAGVGLLRNQKH